MAVQRSRAVGASGGFVEIDYSAVTVIQQAFRDLAAATKAKLRAAMADSAKEFADTWKANLSYSSWQADAVEVTSAAISSRGLFTVRLDSSRAPTPDHEPLPRLMEFGVPFFRHPVYGNRAAWVSQKGHPAMRPAIEASAPSVRAKASAALLEAARSVGLI